MITKRTVFIVLLFTSNFAFGGNSEITLDSLADICEAMENAIVDINAEYEFSTEPPVQEPKKGVLVGIGPRKCQLFATRPFLEQFNYKENFSVMDENGNIWDNEQNQQSYNGNTAKNFKYGGWPSKVQRGTITNQKPLEPRKADTPLIYTVHYFDGLDLSLSGFLREKEKYVSVLDNQIRKINDFNAISVDIFAQFDGKKFITERVYFSIDHSFTPIKFESFNGKTSNGGYEVIELKNINGIWFPVKGFAKFSFYRQNSKHVYTATNIVLNQGLKKEKFNIDFLPGTKVTDKIIGKEYTIKPTEEQVNQSLPK